MFQKGIRMNDKPKLHIIAGFLGAGKTTFLNKYLKILPGKTVVIENEAGTVGIDGALLPEDTTVREISAGCICCTLAPKLHDQLNDIAKTYEPDQIVIEPSGVGNLSDIAKHCTKFGFKPTLKIAMVDASEFEDYSESFGTFYMDQVENANLVMLTHQNEMTSEDINEIANSISNANSEALVLKSDWRELGDSELLDLLQSTEEINTSAFESQEEDNHNHCENNEVHEHNHHHHDHSFKNNGFTQLMFEDLKPWDNNTARETSEALNTGEFGEIFRAKGFCPFDKKRTFYFDFTPKHMNCRELPLSQSIGKQRMIVIGKNLNEEKLKNLFEQ